MLTVRAAVLTYVALLALLALTVGSTLFNLGAANTIINLAVAVAKAALIGLAFMHLRRSGVLVSLTITAVLLWLALLFSLPLLDFVSR